MDVVKDIWDTFHRKGRLADFGEELSVIELLRVDKGQDARADTNEFGVLLRRYTETEAPFSFPRKTSVG